MMWIHLQDQGIKSNYCWFDSKSSVDKIQVCGWATNVVYKSQEMLKMEREVD